MDGCATPGCERTPAWPSVRRSKTWCQPCLADLCKARGYEPAEPLTGRKDRWLITHLACGHSRHSNLDSVRKDVPVCWHCRAGVGWDGRDYLRTPRTTPIPDSYYQPTRDLFASLGAILLEDPRDADAGGPLDWKCAKCGYISAHTPSDLKKTSAQSWFPCHQCDQARLRGDRPVILYYSQRGLDLITTPAKDWAQAYDATCRRCGTLRRVSARALSGGTPPCLNCDGLNMEPSAPHRVYLFHFPALGVLKVGLTNAADHSRLRAHIAHGGLLLEVITVRNRAAAFQIERTILDQFRGWPAWMTETEFPQGGFTECWAEGGGTVGLASTAVKIYLGGSSAPAAV